MTELNRAKGVIDFEINKDIEHDPLMMNIETLTKLPVAGEQNLNIGPSYEAKAID